MKRADLIRHIESHGCVLVREGGNHTVYRNPATSSATTATSSATTVPCRTEIKKQLARKICDDLGIPRREQSTERRSLPKPEAVSWVWENSDRLTSHIAEQPKHNNEDQNRGDAAAAKLPGCSSREQSAQWSFHYESPS